MSYDVKVFSKKTEGSVKVAPNFGVNEFACKDGSDVVIINMALPELLQTIRNHFNTLYPGAWITITSSYRTVAYNNRISGSSSESQHCNGNAADFIVQYGSKKNPLTVPPAKVADYAESIMQHYGGVGRYAGFTHVDVRKAKARWRG